MQLPNELYCLILVYIIIPYELIAWVDLCWCTNFDFDDAMRHGIKYIGIYSLYIHRLYIDATYMFI